MRTKLLKGLLTSHVFQNIRPVATTAVRMTKNLFVFDFDNTVIDGNTEPLLYNVAPVGGVENLPSSIRSLIKTTGWRAFMNAGLKHLAENSVSVEDLKVEMCRVPLVPGFAELIQTLSSNPHNTLIVLSDSAVSFIEWILEKHSLLHLFDKVFANAFVEEGTPPNSFYSIQNYENQTECSECPANLCKKLILKRFMELNSQNGIKFSHICYVGDGANDVCPCKGLRENEDIAFVRDGKFPFCKALQKGLKLPCETVMWNDGFDILKHLDKTSLL